MLLPVSSGFLAVPVRVITIGSMPSASIVSVPFISLSLPSGTKRIFARFASIPFSVSEEVAVKPESVSLSSMLQ